MARATAAVRLLAGDKEPVRLASTANLALAGLLTVDGVATVAGDRVLAKNQTDATQNGIYTASEGTWFRAPDANASRTLRKGMMVYVQEGTQADNVWVLSTNEPDLGSDNITFTLYLSTNFVQDAESAQLAAEQAQSDAEAAETAAAASAAAAAASATQLASGMVLGLVPKTSTVTITIASPGVVTWASHGLGTTAPVTLTTTGSLPTGLTASTVYYAINVNANTFRLATSVANALAGTAINTSGSQSGTHTAVGNGVVPPGYSGEVKTTEIAIGAGPSLTDNVDAVWATLSLEAGIWEVDGNAGVFHTTGTPIVIHMHCDHNASGVTTIGTSPNGGSTLALHVTANDKNGWIFAMPRRRYVLTATTTVRAVMLANFSGGTPKAYGVLRATRI
jgi:hypothetical protein